MSGLSSYAAYAKEPTKNTREVPDHLLAGLTGFNFQPQQAHIMHDVLVGGRITEPAFSVGNMNPVGTLSTQLVPASTAELWELCLGNNVTSGTGPTWTHTATPADPLPTGSYQGIIAEETSGTLRALDLIGAMVADWTLSWDATGDGNPVGWDISLAAHDLKNTETPVTNTQPSTGRWTTVQVCVELAGAEFKCDSGSLTGTNPLRASQQAQCGALAGKPTMFNNGRRTYTADVVADFEGWTEYDRIAAGTEASLVIKVQDATHSCIATLNVRTISDSPPVTGPEAVKIPLSFVGTSTTSDANVITVVTTNADSAA